MEYKPHGNYRIWCEGNTLHAELLGAWNMEAALAYTKDFIEQASAFEGDWAHIVYLDNWELATPDVTAEAERLVEWCIAHGLKRAAQVYKPSGLKRAVINKMVVEQLGDFKRATFDDPETAAQWIIDEGFKTK